MVNKRLVFSFYIDDNTLENKVNQLHLRCISYYNDIFDNVTIVFLINDITNIKLITEISKHITKLRNGKEIEFIIEENNEFRESYVFNKYVVERIIQNEIVLFAHNKGITNILNYKHEDIFYWITFMYYYNLQYIDEVYNSLINKKYVAYGTLMSYNKDIEIETFNKYSWYYLGTFFWVNMNKIRDIINNRGDKLPTMNDRFYDEEFLGNLFEISLRCTSHNNQCSYNLYDLYNNTIEKLSHIYPEEIDNFNNFYKKMTTDGLY